MVMQRVAVVVCFLALAGLAHAAAFGVAPSAEKDLIYPDEVAYYTLLITNGLNDTDSYSVSTQDYDWIIDTSSAETVAPGQTARYLLELTPKPSITSGPHAVAVKVRSSATGDFELVNIPVSIRSLTGGTRSYAPSIFMSAQVPATVDPREDLRLSVYLRNRNARVYDKLTIHVESDLFSKDYTTTLGSVNDEGEKTTQISIPIDPLTEAGSHDITVRILVNDTAVNEYKTRFAVVAYDDTNVATTSSTSWFKTVITYTVTSGGNQRTSVPVRHPTNFFKRLFTDASADYTVEKRDDGSYLLFPVTLDSQQQVELSVTENFRLLALLALLVVVSVISYFVFRSPIVLRKEAMITGASGDGVSKMKIRIFIKNRSAKAVHTLHVVDRVTSMAEVMKENGLGTLQPSKVITKKGHGTLVRWDIDTLDPFEERIITYTAHTQLSLIGDVYLPAAKAKFDQHGRERTSYSNEVNIPREG